MTNRGYTASYELAKVFSENYKPLGQDINRLDEALGAFRHEGRHQLGKNLNQMNAAVHSLKLRLTGLMRNEEEHLFPFIITHVPKFQPLIYLLLSEHEDFRKFLRRLAISLAALKKKNEISESSRRIHNISEESLYLVCLLRNHLWMENDKIFEALRKELHASEKEKLVTYLS